MPAGRRTRNCAATSRFRDEKLGSGGAASDIMHPYKVPTVGPALCGSVLVERKPSNAGENQTGTPQALGSSGTRRHRVIIDRRRCGPGEGNGVARDVIDLGGQFGGSQVHREAVCPACPSHHGRARGDMGTFHRRHHPSHLLGSPA